MSRYISNTEQYVPLPPKEMNIQYQSFSTKFNITHPIKGQSSPYSQCVFIMQSFKYFTLDIVIHSTNHLLTSY
jgi:hypothetical protein